MKKIFVITVLLMMVAGSAFAATTTTSAGASLTATDPATMTICTASKNVRLGVNYDDANGTGYALSSYHTQGTKMYGTAFDSTQIFFQDVGANYTGFAAPSSSVSLEAFSTGWTSM